MTNFEKLTQDKTALAKLIFDVANSCNYLGILNQLPSCGIFCAHCPFCLVNCRSVDGIEKWLNEEAE